MFKQKAICIVQLSDKKTCFLFKLAENNKPICQTNQDLSEIFVYHTNCLSIGMTSIITTDVIN